MDSPSKKMAILTVPIANDKIAEFMKNGSNIYSSDILRSGDVMATIGFFKNKFDVTFGIGPNDTLYLFGDDLKIPPNMCFNIPANITYNGYNREVLVTEFFPEKKVSTLNELTLKSLPDLSEVYPDIDIPFDTSENAYLNLREWIIGGNEEHQMYPEMSKLYLNVNQAFKYDENMYKLYF